MAQEPVKVRRIDLYPDDFLGGTVGLDDAEFGLYARAVLLIYSTGGPITIERLRAVSKSHGHAFKRCLKTLLNLGKLIENDGQISNKRCANELQRAFKRVENRKAYELTRVGMRAPSPKQSAYNNTTYGPLRDPVEIAKERGLRK